MELEKKHSILTKIKRLSGPREPLLDNDLRSKRREKIIVFTFAYLMALSLWFIVNLNRDYRISIDVPIEKGAIPSNMALVDGLPENLQVEVSGDGWKLINLYNNPPEIPINLIEGEVNLFNQVRQRFTLEKDISVLKVEPLVINIELEPKISKKIPIQLHTVLDFAERYGLVNDPVFEPDSIIITGAQSHVKNIDKWLVSDTLYFSQISKNLTEVVAIDTNDPLIELDVKEIKFIANVSEFTEGEVSVFIRTRDIPRGSIINYNPSTVTIKFDVPIEQYANIQNQKLYEVYVPYDEILEDVTGFVTPDIELIATDFKIKLRSFQPKAVAYFSVLDD